VKTYQLESIERKEQGSLNLTHDISLPAEQLQFRPVQVLPPNADQVAQLYQSARPPSRQKTDMLPTCLSI
jgi:hypothetical protein